MAERGKSRKPRKRKVPGKGQGRKGWLMVHFPAIASTIALLFVLAVSLAALGYVVFLAR